MDATLGSWPLVRPTTSESLVQTLEDGIPPACIIWLDELQEFLAGDVGALAADYLYELLSTPGVRPFLVAATIWPTFLAKLSMPSDYPSSPPRDAVPKLLRFTAPNRLFVPDDFESTDAHLLQEAALADRRIRWVVSGSSRQITQVLAGGVHLLERYEHEQEPAAKAVLTAALDLRRVGYPNLIPSTMLRDVAPGYLTPDQRVQPDDWFDAALADCVREVHGVSALTPIRTASGVGPPDSYRPHDYLVQYGILRRRRSPTTVELWDALTDPKALSGLAPDIVYAIGMEANNRGLYTTSTVLFRAAAIRGDESARRSLARLLAVRRDLDGLRRESDADNRYAQDSLAEFLAGAQDIDGLRALTDRGSLVARQLHARLLFMTGDTATLRSLADAGDESAQYWLVNALDRDGDLEGLRSLASAGSEVANSRLSNYLAAREAEDETRSRAGNGDGVAQYNLVQLLARRGDVRGLRALADKGTPNAGYELANMLVRTGDMEGLFALADSGNEHGQSALANVLRERNDDVGLLRQARAGNWYALGYVVSKLEDRGDLDGLRALECTGDKRVSGGILSVLRRRGDLSALRAAGAQHLLIGLLADRGDLEGLRAEADAGDRHAPYEVARLLKERGDLDGLRELAAKEGRGGSVVGFAHDLLLRCIEERDGLDGLRAEAESGDDVAKVRLLAELASQGDIESLRALADEGNSYQEKKLADLLAERGDEDGLRAESFAGSWAATEQLIRLLAESRRLSDTTGLELDPLGRLIRPVDGESGYPYLADSGGS
ncbi:hypothetical protein [Geodermatophilus sp. CPCC 205761]|uniref:hypothetical protein n=1 Tax=Geodermatophilus sp. CPCC 205761 TaxID=2936597 RepID=UPI003EEDFAC8